MGKKGVLKVECEFGTEIPEGRIVIAETDTIHNMEASEVQLSSQEVGAWFQQEADELLDECRLDHYYIGKPCDCFLTYLLLCSFPYDVFREIFKTDRMQRSGYREENI